MNNFEKKGPISWMINNSVVANILMIILLVGGLFSATQVKQEFLPDAELDEVFVTVVYPGASPEEVEQGIILTVEESIRGINGIKRVVSRANETAGIITAEVMEKTDVSRVADDVRNAVNGIRTFPLDAEEPTISIVNLKRPVLDLIVSADVPQNTLREITEDVRDALLLSDGITQVELANIRTHEINVEITQQKLRELGLSLQDIANILSRSSVELPGGSIRTDQGEILVRVMDKKNIGEEFAQIPIINDSDGTKLLLQDIAIIKDGFDESDKFTFYNNKPAVSITVFRTGKETPISIEASVNEVVEKLELTMPDGVEFKVWDSRADAYRGRMALLLRNGLLGLTLVFILLSLFLEMRLAFWVMLGIPISFAGTFIFMTGADVSLNMITMFAFLISLGIVVDDAIVVGENIYHYHQEGMPFLSAAIKGAKQIATPVSFSIITNVIAFMPLYFVPGIMGKFFRVIPLVVCSTFLISLIESLFILPAHLGHQKDEIKKTSWFSKLQSSFSNAFNNFAKNVYGPFLDKVLRARYIAFSISLVILIITLGFIKSGRGGFELFPSVESDIALCAYYLPYGSSVESTKKAEKELIEAGYLAAQKVEDEYGKPIVKDNLSTIGGLVWGRMSQGGGHAGRIKLELMPPKDRPITNEEFVRRWREEAKNVKGLRNARFRSDSGQPGGERDAFNVDLSHRDMKILEQASKELAAELASYPMVIDINDGFMPGKQQLDFSILPEGRSLGLTSQDVARQVRNSYYGAEAIRQQRGRNEVKIKVRLPIDERQTEFSLEELIIRTPAGLEVPLREVAEIERGRSYTFISRRDGRRVVSVSGDVVPNDQTPLILEAMKQDLLPPLMKKYSGLSYSFEGREADRRESVNGLIKGLLAALVMIYVVLAIPFKSYTQPLIIMISIPFGIVGAVIGHLLLGYSLSLISLFGVVALSGVVVNDALVFIDFANKKNWDGESLVDSVRAAGIQRFRPIILTTLTTFFGLMPMILETSQQAKFLIPMAISLGFGILFATGITLLIIPSLMLILDDIHNLFRKPAS